MRYLFLVFCALSLTSGSVLAENEEYIFGVPVDCTEATHFQSFPVDLGLPPLLRFLLGPNDSLIFTSGSIGSELRPGSNGAIHLARSAFGITLKPIKIDDTTRLSGTIEIRQPKAYCELLKLGISLNLNAAGLDFATVTLVPRGTSGIEELSAGKTKTTDRIGRKYFDSFQRFLSNDFFWVTEWLEQNDSPFDIDIVSNEYAVGFDPRGLSPGRVSSFPYSVTHRLGYPSNLAYHLEFMEKSGLYLQDFPKSKDMFLLSDLSKYGLFAVYTDLGGVDGIGITTYNKAYTVFNHSKDGLSPQ